MVDLTMRRRRNNHGHVLAWSRKLLSWSLPLLVWSLFPFPRIVKVRDAPARPNQGVLNNFLEIDPILAPSADFSEQRTKAAKRRPEDVYSSTRVVMTVKHSFAYGVTSPFLSNHIVVKIPLPAMSRVSVECISMRFFPLSPSFSHDLIHAPAHHPTAPP